MHLYDKLEILLNITLYILHTFTFFVRFKKINFASHLAFVQLIKIASIYIPHSCV